MLLKLLWLDDIRDPMENDWLVFSPLDAPYEVNWVKTYQEFTSWILEHGMPDGICFDHDLSDFQAFYNGWPDKLKEDYDEAAKLGNQAKWDERIETEKTGMDCARWIVDRCLDSDDLLPKWNIQSANAVGAENIRGLLTNFKKHYPHRCS